MSEIPTRIRPLPLPQQYSAEHARSDEDQIHKIYVDHGKQRTEDYNADVTTIYIWRSDLRKAYRIEMRGDSGTYFTIPITEGMSAAAEVDMEDEIEWEHVGTETLDSHEVNVFDEFVKGRLARHARVYVDVETHIRWKTVSYNRLGKEVMTIEARNVEIGPPPASVFELPSGLKELRIKLSDSDSTPRSIDPETQTMPSSTIRIEAGEAEFLLTISLRDLMLLAGPHPFMPDGDVFTKTMGFFDNFTVLRGVPKDSKSIRNRHLVLAAATSLLETIERDLDLLEFDYSYSFTARGKARCGGCESGFSVQGHLASIDSRPNGFCTLKLSESSPNGRGRVVQIHDLRNRQTIETDDSGPIKIHRKKGKEVGWKSSLPALIEFLNQQKCADVVIHHNPG